MLTPAVVAHRGASGHRPEHTLEAYRTAIRMGADDIELDLVISRDGVLVARHESQLGATTDVARRPEFAHRHCRRVVDGVELSGWFVEDFTLAELRTLTARERMPTRRPASAAHDGLEGIATFDEVLAMVGTESARRGRGVGVMVELKHATHFDARGLPLEEPLLADLARHRLDHPWARVTLMSFETTVLRRLARRTRLPIVQLLDRPHVRPVDLVAAGDPRTYADLAAPVGLEQVDEYADGVGAHKSLVMPPDAAGAVGAPSSLVHDAHRLGLTVHVWTLRRENAFLPTNFRSAGSPDAPGDLAAEARAFLDAGVDGLITDHPGVVLRARGGVPVPLASST